MKLNEVNEIVECLPKGKTHFYYFKDRYALVLLGLAIDKPMTVPEIRQSRYSRLLEKPVIKNAISNCGSGMITADVSNSIWSQNYECYLLSLGSWGSKERWWDQTTRGGHNLVLQLNFSTKHDDPYRKLIDPDEHLVSSKRIGSADNFLSHA